MLTVSSVERRQATRRCEKIDFCVLGLLKNQQLTGAEIAIFQFFHSFPFPTCEFSPLDRGSRRWSGSALQNKVLVSFALISEWRNNRRSSRFLVNEIIIQVGKAKGGVQADQRFGGPKN